MISHSDPVTSVFNKYDFRWEVLDVIVAGKSLIDTNRGLSGFPMHNLEDVDRFLRSYGFEIDNPIEGAEIVGIFHESINFIRKYFIQGPDNSTGLNLEIPRKILELQDIRNLFLMASMNFPGQANDTPGVRLKNWACSVLRVMHSVAHIDKDLRATYFSDIQTQILDRFYGVIHRDDNKQLYLGREADDPFRVDLVRFETKPKKARESILLKLLHKSENVADDIFDRVGIRFVTALPLDTLRVVKFLKESLIVMPANIKPSRSRNTLLDLSRFKDKLLELQPALAMGEMAEEEVRQQLGQAATFPEGSTDNPHSSEFYRAIQFTCRQLIKLKNPLYEDLKQLKSLAKTKTVHQDVFSVIERIDLKYIQREIRFFYPYEVQVMDEKAYEENERGRSAHSSYKKAQIQTAMKRVMAELMNVG